MEPYQDGPMLDQSSQMMSIIQECHMITDGIAKRLRPVTQMNKTDSSRPTAAAATEMEEGLMALMTKLQDLNQSIHI